MGLLSEGIPLEWNEAKKLSRLIRKRGIQQLLNVMQKHKSRHHTCFKWGDEVEYYVIHFDHDKKKATLSLRGPEIIDQSQKIVSDEGKTRHNHASHSPSSIWHPEFGSFMMEGTPGRPYSNKIIHYWAVEENMIYRRRTVEQALKPNEALLTIGAYPMMGVGEFTTPPHRADPLSNPSTRSIFFSDQCCSPHPRFSALARNIRRRRGKKVSINLPVYQDTNTDFDLIKKLNSGCLNEDWYDENGEIENEHQDESQNPRVTNEVPVVSVEAETDVSESDGKEMMTDEEIAEQYGTDGIHEGAEAALDKHVYMDAMGFGMGSCCLQCTFQACGMKEARKLYDMLMPIGPIMLALSAGTPIYRGVLVDTDTRWNIIENAVDDRSEEDKKMMPKSRYGTNSLYISEHADFDEKYNDIEVPIDQESYDALIEGGLDERLARHFASLFTRDPLVIYREGIENDDSDSLEHFENIQSTNWNVVRFKPPSPDGKSGWRVEFRTMELGLTDFENAAHAVFISFLCRAVTHWNANYYIPISKVDENAHTASLRDAVNTKKFWFRKCVCPNRQGEQLSSCELALMTLDEIINGCDGFSGLVPLMRALLNELEEHDRISNHERPVLDSYLSFISDRASGKLMNTASWIRNFVHNHPKYNHDSLITHEINYDLLKACHGIANGEVDAPELFGEYNQRSWKSVGELHHHLATHDDLATSEEIRSLAKLIKKEDICISQRIRALSYEMQRRSTRIASVADEEDTSESTSVEELPDGQVPIVNSE